MPDNEYELKVMLPEQLRRQFAALQRRLWRVESTLGLCSCVVAFCLSVFALFISDRFWNTPPALRLVLTLLALLALGAAAIWWARRWLWHKRTTEDLANLVQRKYRLLGDRLLGIVELAQERRHNANFSAELYHAAINQVAADASQYDFQASVDRRPARGFAWIAGLFLVCAAALTAILPQAMFNVLRRWSAPLADIPRYTLVSIEGLPREMVVAQGEPFMVSARVQYRSFWKPEGAAAQFPPRMKVDGRVAAGQVALQIPSQVESGIMRVTVGDAEARINITPVYRPALRELNARIQFPEYLQYPDQTNNVQSGTLTAVEGSQISFFGKTSRPLLEGTLTSAGNAPSALAVTAENFSSSLTKPEGLMEYAFFWKDKLGLSNAAPLRLSVATQKDEPPAADIVELPRESAMLGTDVLHIHTEGHDDFGVRDLGLTWQVISDTPLTESLTSEVKIMPATNDARLVKKDFLWSPLMYRIPPDSTVELQGFARDFFPGRERSRTPVYRIHILTAEEHAEMIRQQLEDVMARIEEVTRLQEKIVANLNDIKSSETLAPAQKAARAGQSKNDQLENASRLNELSRKAQESLEQAIKNPAFPPETIKQWSQSAQKWQNLAEQKMQEAAEAMQSAEQRQSQPSQDSQPSQPGQKSQQTSKPGSQSKNQNQSQESMNEAAKKAEDVLNALEELQAKAGENLDNLQALTLSQRLKKIGSDESDISARLLKKAPEIIGLPPDELSEPLKHFEVGLTNDQGRARVESDKLHGEISRFFERTRKTNYGAVSKEMEETHTVDQLEHVGGLIGENIAVEASSDLDGWSKRFVDWSEKLQPPAENSGGGQQSGGQQSKQPDLTKQLIALLRLRESEMNLQNQTSLLDQNKGTPENYKDQADSLAKRQRNLGGELDLVHQAAPLPQLSAAFSQTEGEMEKTASILETPQTGRPAADSEIKTVDALTDLVNLINEQAQRNGQSQSQSKSEGQKAGAEEMAFLMRMMQNTQNAKAMAMQPAQGFNHAGGSTQHAGSGIRGNTNGKNGPSRDVEKSSGVMQNAPAEFRDALDNYFHGIEQNKN